MQTMGDGRESDVISCGVRRAAKQMRGGETKRWKKDEEGAGRDEL